MNALQGLGTTTRGVLVTYPYDSAKHKNGSWVLTVTPAAQGNPAEWRREVRSQFTPEKSVNRRKRHYKGKVTETS